MGRFWKNEELGKYISANLMEDATAREEAEAYRNIIPENKEPFAPEFEDLSFLYKKIRERRALKVLEFGIVYSA